MGIKLHSSLHVRDVHKQWHHSAGSHIAPKTLLICSLVEQELLHVGWVSVLNRSIVMFVKSYVVGETKRIYDKCFPFWLWTLLSFI